MVDGDVVDVSNLQRQVIHHTQDVGVLKVRSAKKKIEEMNPDVKVVVFEEHLHSKNILSLIRDYDILIDGTDNFPAKFLINDAAVLSQKPLIHGGILRFEGQAMTIIPNQTACYRCIFKGPPPSGLVPSCQEAGVLGVLAGLIGTIQATEVLKLILNIGNPLFNRILVYDALKVRFREVPVKRNPACPVCGEKPTITELVDYEQEVCRI
jgi:adenylyltransferase/sulfurtransferase